MGAEGYPPRCGGGGGGGGGVVGAGATDGGRSARWTAEETAGGAHTTATGQGAPPAPAAAAAASPDAGLEVSAVLARVVFGKEGGGGGGGGAGHAPELRLRLRLGGAAATAAPAEATTPDADLVLRRSGANRYAAMLDPEVKLHGAGPVAFEVGVEKERWVCGEVKRGEDGRWTLERAPTMRGAAAAAAGATNDGAPVLELSIVGRCDGEPVCVQLVAPFAPRRATHRHHGHRGAPQLEAITEDENQGPADTLVRLRGAVASLNPHEPGAEDGAQPFDLASYANAFLNLDDRNDRGGEADSTWFKVGLRLGVGVGLGATLGLGLGAAVVNRAWQNATGTVSRVRGFLPSLL